MQQQVSGGFFPRALGFRIDHVPRGEKVSQGWIAFGVVING